MTTTLVKATITTASAALILYILAKTIKKKNKKNAVLQQRYNMLMAQRKISTVMQETKETAQTLIILLNQSLNTTSIDDMKPILKQAQKEAKKLKTLYKKYKKLQQVIK